MESMDIQKPELILNERQCLSNLSKMLEKARQHHVAFRPHFKTHQSLEIGQWHKNLGVDRITVSSNRMASYFLNDGWKDITVAFPVNIREIGLINEMAVKSKLGILLSTPDVLPFLVKQIRNEVFFYIEIDNGAHRSGIAPFEVEILDSILEKTKNTYLRFSGFLTHAGNTYAASSVQEILDIHNNSLLDFEQLKSRYQSQYPDMEFSMGDTPSCSLASDFACVTEIRPGNYLFYDVMQYLLGSCTLQDIALSMYCPVVAVYEKRKQAIIYGGAIHFSKDFVIDRHGRKIFGLPAIFNPNGEFVRLIDGYLSSLSQEHGVVTLNDDLTNELKYGDVLGILPVHACLTADCMTCYWTTEGEKIEMMPESSSCGSTSGT